MPRPSLGLPAFVLGTVLPALLAGGTASCESASPEPLGPDSPAPVIGVPFELRAGARVTLAEEDLRIEFQQVSQDSRCPTDVTCVWEGDASVRLELSHPRADPASVELHTSPSFAREASYAGFRVALLELRPRPRSDERIEAEDYVARLEVRREAEGEDSPAAPLGPAGP